MKCVIKIAFALLLVNSVVNAQSVSAATGRWSGTMKSPQTGNELTIKANISELNGTWVYASSGNSKKAGPCLNRELPLLIKTLSNTKMMFSVDGASQVAGCPSFNVNFERSDDQTLTGVFGDGRSVTLKKE